MSNRAEQQSTVERAEKSDDPEPEAVQTVEAYETDGSVVLFDAEDPLAWIETDLAIPISEIA